MKCSKDRNIDAVDILVPIESNYTVSEAVAKAGKDFICEKPLAANREEAKKYLELSKKYNVRIMIAENYRYSDEYNKIRDIVNRRKNRGCGILYKKQHILLPL